MTQTMDLNKMGLAPMSELEMQEADGGWVWWPYIAVYVLVEVALNPTAHLKAFMDGFNGK